MVASSYKDHIGWKPINYGLLLHVRITKYDYKYIKYSSHVHSLACSGCTMHYNSFHGQPIYGITTTTWAMVQPGVTTITPIMIVMFSATYMYVAAIFNVFIITRSIYSDT